MPLWDPFKSKVYINGILEAMFNLAVPCNYKIGNVITIINIHYQYYQLSVLRTVFDTWVILKSINEILLLHWTKMILGI